MKRIVSYNADGDLGEEYSEVDVEYDEIPVNVSEYFEEHMNVYDIMTSRHVSSLDIEQVELDTLRKMYETLKNGGDTYGNTDDVAVYMDSLKADIEMYEREEQERNDRVNWLWQLDLKTCPLEEIFKIDYDEVMSFGGELALGVGERLENELKNTKENDKRLIDYYNEVKGTIEFHREWIKEQEKELERERKREEEQEKISEEFSYDWEDEELPFPD